LTAELLTIIQSTAACTSSVPKTTSNKFWHLHYVAKHGNTDSAFSRKCCMNARQCKALVRWSGKVNHFLIVLLIFQVMVRQKILKSN